MDGSFAADKRRARPRFFFSQAERAARARLGHVWGQKIIIKKGGLRYELAAKPLLSPPRQVLPSQAAAGAAPPAARRGGGARTDSGAGRLRGGWDGFLGTRRAPGDTPGHGQVVPEATQGEQGKGGQR